MIGLVEIFCDPSGSIVSGIVTGVSAEYGPQPRLLWFWPFVEQRWRAARARSGAAAPQCLQACDLFTDSTGSSRFDIFNRAM